MADGALVLGVGARAGLGGALCARFAREGMAVFPFGRTAAAVQAIAGELRGTAIAGDCTLPADVARAFDVVEKETGAPPKLVVYNAGNMAAGAIADMDPAFFESAWRVCAFGAFLCGREVVRRMGRAGAGTLLFTGATASLRARPPFTAFASAKAAERAIAQGLARELGPQGVHVAHVIVDGVIDGDQVNARIPQLKERLGADGMLSVDALADAYWMVHAQPRSAWTFELDLRPYKESF